ncbi:hypothetical protein KHQ81_09085 [Mycoplasmatota bacterium]|nr:hypothetical protein KHQ81_09085 [Mycoplasmatota bacterium]
MLVDIDLSDYYNAGYMLVKITDRASCMNDNVLPQKILSVSACICDQFPFEVKKARESLHIDNKTFKVMKKWVQVKINEGKIFCNSLFIDLSDIKEFYNLFFTNLNQIKIIGLNIHKKYFDIIIEEENNHSYGVAEVIKPKRPADSTGKILGYEILGDFHSYICNGLEDDYYKEFNLKLNSNGFISSLEESEMLANYTNENELGEPVFWLSWLIIEY